MDNQSLESQEMKQVPSSIRTITDESSEYIMIDDKGRYHMTSSATKKLVERINRFSPVKSSSDMMNDEKVVGKHTPSISEKTFKVTEDS